MLYAFFWVISPASEFYMPTFRNTLFHPHRQVGTRTYLPMKMGQSVPKRRHIKLRRRGNHPNESIHTTNFCILPESDLRNAKRHKCYPNKNYFYTFVPILRYKHMTYTHGTRSDLCSTHEIIRNVSSWKITDTALGGHRENCMQFIQVSGMMGHAPTEAAYGLQAVHEEVRLYYRRSFLRNAGGAVGIPTRNCILFSHSAYDMLDLPVQYALTSSGPQGKCLFVSNMT